MKYAAIFEQGELNWSAYVPDLLGCTTAGDTLEETKQLMREAIEIYIEALREDGLPVPQPSSHAVDVEVPSAA